MTTAFRVLCVPGGAPTLAASAYGPFELLACDSLDGVAQRLHTAPQDAVLLDLPDPAVLLTWAALSLAVLDAAVVVAGPAPAPDLAARLLQLGVQDVLHHSPGAHAGSNTEPTARALRLAIERKRIEQAQRKAYATDLSTGLPNHTQLHEHMSHLLALREREPAPMALVVLRIEGLVRVAETLGAEAANVLRRKAAVRLRSLLRASDVVASLGADAFAVLLAWMDTPQAGEHVTAKLAQALAMPYTVAGRTQTLGVGAGLASYPEHGKDADSLLRRALGQAASVATVGAAGMASRADRGPAAAANDDEA